MTSGGKRPVILSSELELLSGRSDEDKKAFPMKMNDWLRLRRLADRIRPAVAWWNVTASIFAGGALSCIVNWWVALNAANKDMGAINANGYIGLGCVALAIVCFIGDRSSRAATTNSAASLVEEMDMLEETLTDAFPRQPTS